MRATNQKKLGKLQKFGLFQMLMVAFGLKGMDAKSATARASHQAYLGYGSPEFIPRKHTVQSYRSQQREAKKRRRAK